MYPSLTGTVSDPDGGTIVSFKMNGLPLSLGGVNWVTMVTLTNKGWSSIYFEAVDGNDNVTNDTLHIYVHSDGWNPKPPTLPPLP
jgi:hypothetical protein